MLIKYTNHFLTKIEDLFAESDYILRYEKGNFQSGYCIIKETKVVIVNKYFPIDGKINALLEILRTIPLDVTHLGDKSRGFYAELTQTSLKI